MPKSGPNVSIPAKLLATAVALAVSLVVCGTAATVMVSSEVANEVSEKFGRVSSPPDLAKLGREPFRHRGDGAALLDSLTAHPALRSPIVLGGCRHVREVVFGFSHARRAAVERAAVALSDIPRSQELAALYVKQLDQITGDPEQQVPGMSTGKSVRLSSLGSLDWIVPPGVRARVAMCSAWGSANIP
jgi:hypothetical protein